MKCVLIDSTARSAWQSATSQQAQLEGLDALFPSGPTLRYYTSGGTHLRTVTHAAGSINTSASPRTWSPGALVADTPVTPDTATYVIAATAPSGGTDILRADIAPMTIVTGSRPNLQPQTGAAGLVVRADSGLPVTPAPSWDADIGLTVSALASSVSAGSFAALASGARALDFYGAFVPHQGTVYFSDYDIVVCFGAETHNSEPYYTNSPRIIDMATSELWRAQTDDAFADFRIDTDGIPWSTAAHVAPWGMHAMRQIVRVGSEIWVCYNAINHANFFQDSIIPIPREGVATTVRACIWAWTPADKSWRFIDGGANNANVATLIAGVGYAVLYNSARNSLMGVIGSNWRELSLADYALVGSSPAMSGSGFNCYSLLLDDGTVLAGAGGSAANGTLALRVDPASPSGYTTISKTSVAALSGLSMVNTAWCKLPSGKVLAFAKDQSANTLRPIIFDPTADTWTDSGHSLSVGATAAADGYYWQQCCYADAAGVVVLSNNNSTLNLWAYKPAAGV